MTLHDVGVKRLKKITKYIEFIVSEHDKLYITIGFALKLTSDEL